MKNALLLILLSIPALVADSRQYQWLHQRFNRRGSAPDRQRQDYP